MDRLHRRFGARVVVFLAVAVAAVDILRISSGVNEMGLLTELLVWLTIHQLGFCYADGSLVAAGKRFLASMTFGALAVTVILTLVTHAYPVTMVSFGGSGAANTNPADLALLSHGCWLVGLAMLLRPAVNRVLRNRRIWTGVIIGNGVIMTVFCWHLTATFLAEGALGCSPTSWCRPPAASPGGRSRCRCGWSPAVSRWSVWSRFSAGSNGSRSRRPPDQGQPRNWPRLAAPR
ncbi:hypothetical protein [Fodinicola feengrottensis]|uniref:hypothetical protein n=1 Tax=Fodinicola feengrottensis TaxID=435914 RepID=UPI0013D4F7FE|nr:hypothetical protein [Fodinicola feengrottensis]